MRRERASVLRMRETLLFAREKYEGVVLSEFETLRGPPEWLAANLAVIDRALETP